jgi:hypothetical protein
MTAEQRSAFAYARETAGYHRGPKGRRQDVPDGRIADDRAGGWHVRTVSVANSRRCAGARSSRLMLDISRSCPRDCVVSWLPEQRMDFSSAVCLRLCRS